MATTAGAPGTTRRYFHSLWLLSARDLKVRYSTSALGYLWSVLDPLVMSAIYWFVFTQVFQRTVGEQPYIIFLISALLPWVWFNSAVGDFTRAFKKDARLVRSTAIPRSIWVNRIVLSKGLEFVFSMPVLLIFVLVNRLTETDPAQIAQISWGVLWLPVAIILQATLLIGLGLLVAPLCALYTDLERTTALILRAMFYATPIIYSVKDLPGPFETIGMFNPLAGIMTLYRMAFFPSQWDLAPVVISAVMSLIILALGVWVFRSLERPVLKEL
ncbi:ABC transporter permease [Microbacterium esteraromaticum]|uniref:Transport permease protein n=1 Tax=Microbacterium esteraromaticum TaxID=57043 RepID=A0A939DUY5_9MICO|nr:ABC transporter permease [Microbacterium esteraromaticum]MBN8205706.1 ABC transporter permease [Microbacterium esteraromaticum]MBN8415860.1 ABC transporter permease [Microbacterium esteraromaticum]WDH79825.1 ABC transporter permease [Microbacterium esteraromaticum]